MDLRYVNLRFLEPFAPLVPIGGTFNPLWIKLSISHKETLSIIMLDNQEIHTQHLIHHLFRLPNLQLLLILGFRQDQ